jgi:hypothetical protein
VDLMTRSMVLCGFAVDGVVQTNLGHLIARLRHGLESCVSTPALGK